MFLILIILFSFLEVFYGDRLAVARLSYQGPEHSTASQQRHLLQYKHHIFGELLRNIWGSPHKRVYVFQANKNYFPREIYTWVLFCKFILGGAIQWFSALSQCKGEPKEGQGGIFGAQI
jgi:hypothetical protein